ncbi:CsbD family protein [Streptomyces sp. NPDC059398]|uniref:CsbD family protein n=1 Tax=Streptomyces sp. NPDC059398 TaxID=3346820 RepID=UPI0036B8E98E
MGDDNAMDKMKGKAKEAAGKMTGDKRQEAEGRTDQAKGKTKDTLGDAKDRAAGAKDSFKD